MAASLRKWNPAFAAYSPHQLFHTSVCPRVSCWSVAISIVVLKCDLSLWLWLFDGNIFLQLSFISVMAPGPKQPPGCEGGRSYKKYQCQGCSLTPRGKDLSRHYKNMTDWTLVGQMRAAMGSAKLAQLKDKADKHTLYIFGRGYTREKLMSQRDRLLQPTGGCRWKRHTCLLAFGRCRRNCTLIMLVSNLPI